MPHLLVQQQNPPAASLQKIPGGEFQRLRETQARPVHRYYPSSMSVLTRKMSPYTVAPSIHTHLLRYSLLLHRPLEQHWIDEAADTVLLHHGWRFV
jgi:hypothetical protein